MCLGSSKKLQKHTLPFWNYDNTIIVFCTGDLTIEYSATIEEKRMEQLFSTSFQEKEDEERIRAELDRQSSSTTDLLLNSIRQDVTEGNNEDISILPYYYHETFNGLIL